MSIKPVGVSLTADGASRFEGDITRANRAVTDFGRDAEKASGGVDVFGTIATGALLKVGMAAVEMAAQATRAIAGFVSDSVAKAADFEASLDSIAAVSGATAAEMEKIGALALQLGADTAFSAGEAAAGLEELIKGGLGVADAMAASKPMLDLAAAGGIDVANAAEIAANALGIFGLKGSDMTNVANQIAGAANASSLSVSDFQMSMSAAGSVAAGVGQSFDDLATAIAIMGKSGIKGSDAGTSLKTMLMNLQPTTKAQKKVFEDLGITVDGMNNKFINADGSFKSMAEIAEVLQVATGGLTDAQRALALEAMFGSDAIRAANIFVKEGAEGFDAMAESMGKVTAESVAATKLDNFSGAVDAMKGSLETLQIIIGTALLPVLTSLVRDHLTPLINSAAAFATAFFDAGDKVGFLVTAIDGLLPGFAGLVGWLQISIPAAIATVSALWTTTLLPTFQSIQPIIDAVVATMQERFNALLGVVQSVLPTIQSIVMSVFGIISGFLQEHGAAILTTLMGAWTTVQGAITQAITLVGSVVQTGLQIVATFLQQHGAEIQGVLGMAWQTIQLAIEVVMAAIQNIIMPVLTAIAGFITAHATEIQAALSGAWNLIQAVIQTTLDLIQGILRTALALIKGDWQGAWDEVKATAETLWNNIKTVVETAINNVKTTIDTVMPTIQSTIETAWTAIKLAAESAWEALRSTVETKIGEVVALAQGLPGQITGALSGLAGDLLQIGIDAIQGLIDGLSSIDVGSILGDIVSGAVDFAKGVIKTNSPSKLTRDVLGKPMGEGIVVGIESTAESVKQAVGKTVLGAIQVAELVKEYRKVGKNMGDALVGGFVDSKPMEAIATKIKTMLGQTIPTDAVPFAGELGSNLGETIANEAVKKLKTVLGQGIPGAVTDVSKSLRSDKNRSDEAKPGKMGNLGQFVQPGEGWLGTAVDTAAATGTEAAQQFAGLFEDTLDLTKPQTVEKLTEYYHELRRDGVGPALTILGDQMYLGGLAGTSKMGEGLTQDVAAFAGIGSAMAAALLAGWGPPVLPAPIMAASVGQQRISPPASPGQLHQASSSSVSNSFAWSGNMVLPPGTPQQHGDALIDYMRSRGL
jgi:TP901 family phage tail tape measure protein